MPAGNRGAEPISSGRAGSVVQERSDSSAKGDSLLGTDIQQRFVESLRPVLRQARASGGKSALQPEPTGADSAEPNGDRSAATRKHARTGGGAEPLGKAKSGDQSS